MSNPALARRLGALLMIALLFGTFACKKKVTPPPPSAGAGRPEQPAAAPSGPTREPTVQIKANPSTIQPGGDVTLDWSSTDAERLTIDNAIGTVAPSGSVQLSPTQSTTYTAVATNRLGSATASTRVTVTEPAEPPPPPAAMDMEIEDIMRRGLIKDVFFDYDQYDLTPQSQETLRQNADYLRRFADVVFTLEGHCDERGTAEYNLALGDRRAQSVKEFLASLGVSPSRLETISYGEERPFAEGQDEAAWAQNRRVHFTLRR